MNDSEIFDIPCFRSSYPIEGHRRLPMLGSSFAAVLVLHQCGAFQQVGKHKYTPLGVMAHLFQTKVFPIVFVP